MRVFRIALLQFGATAKTAFSGQSGYGADGRWHSRGRYLDYAAASRSLATLERLVHYKRFDSLARHVIYLIDVPDEHIETVLTIPPGWDGDDLLPAAQAIGNGWCDQAKSPALQVRSAVTPGEHNLMLNSRHSAWDWKWVRSGPDVFEFDARLAALMRSGP
jgi:RES domain-containing protein